MYFPLSDDGDRVTLYLEGFVVGTEHNSRNLFQPIRESTAPNHT